MINRVFSNIASIPKSPVTRKPTYHKLTVDGDKKTQWICGCFETIDGYFWFCDEHKETLKKTIEAQIDELDMTRVLE